MADIINQLHAWRSQSSDLLDAGRRELSDLRAEYQTVRDDLIRARDRLAEIKPRMSVLASLIGERVPAEAK